MWGISILADLDLWGIRFYAVVVWVRTFYSNLFLDTVNREKMFGTSFVLCIKHGRKKYLVNRGTLLTYLRRYITLSIAKVQIW